jgi:hypothetical protein
MPIESAVFIGCGEEAPGSGRAPAGRIYYGEEACERLLPEPADTARRVRAWRREGREVTLVFPPVSNTGLDAAARILAALAKEKGLECAVNDYGLLSLASRSAPRPRLVVGRILSRVLARNIHDLALYSRAEHSDFLAMLRKLGVARFDFDPFTLERAFPETLGFPMSLISPYALVSFTRRCALARCGNPDKRPFGSCRRQCLESAFTVRNSALHGVFELVGNKILRCMEPPAVLPDAVDRLVEYDPLKGLPGRDRKRSRPRSRPDRPWPARSARATRPSA